MHLVLEASHLDGSVQATEPYTAVILAACAIVGIAIVALVGIAIATVTGRAD